MSEIIDDLQTDIDDILRRLIEDDSAETAQAASEIAILLAEAATVGATRDEFDELYDQARVVAEGARLDMAESAWDILRAVIGVALGVAAQASTGGR